jgi:hypothetical protein
VLRHRPTNDLAGKQIQNDRQIQPAFSRVDVGEITDPFGIDCCGRKVLVQTVGCGDHAWLTLRCDRKAFVPFVWANAFPTHQTCHAMTSTGYTSVVAVAVIVSSFLIALVVLRQARSKAQLQAESQSAVS